MRTEQKKDATGYSLNKLNTRLLPQNGTVIN